MQKAIAVLGSALFFAVAPSVLAGLIPWSITDWEFRPPFFDLQATRAVGMLLIAAGLPGLIDSFARFALQGLGTPAPIAPPQNLVATGLYRYDSSVTRWNQHGECAERTSAFGNCVEHFV